MGLLNHLVPCERLMDSVNEIARQIAANDPRMVAGIKQLLMSGVGTGWQDMYETELAAREGALKPTPVLEGFKDFLSRKGKES
jgi:enoyl-CoA hydratase/carnithine racemase